MLWMFVVLEHMSSVIPNVQVTDVEVNAAAKEEDELQKGKRIW